MKRQAVQDERVLMQSRKVLCEAYSILILALLVSVLVQQFLLKAPVEQYAAEFICFFAASLYVMIRNLMLGINIFSGKSKWKRNSLLSSLIIGLTSAAVNGVLAGGGNTGEFAAMLAVTFACAAGSSFAALSILNYFNNRRQKRIEEELDAEERDT